MKSRELSLSPHSHILCGKVTQSLHIKYTNTHRHTAYLTVLLLAQNFSQCRFHRNPNVYTPFPSSSSTSPVTSHQPAVLSKLHIWKENWSDDQPKQGYSRPLGRSYFSWCVWVSECGRVRMNIEQTIKAGPSGLCVGKSSTMTSDTIKAGSRVA